MLQSCMTKDVFTQLQKISLQQSKIRTLKGKLAVYQDVANKQAETFAELQLIKRVPVAYRHCLAECMRRYSHLLHFCPLTYCSLTLQGPTQFEHNAYDIKRHFACCLRPRS